MPINHSIILGEGEPLCILHGFLGMSDNWKSLGNKYAEAGFEVHLIDQRNHGKSFWSDSFNYKEMSGDLKDYLEHYKIKETALIGHSMGGKTAMEFACNNPELTSKLIVADIAPRYYPPHHTQILNALEQLKLSELTSRNEADTQLKSYISDQGIRQFLLKNLFWKEKKELAFRFNLPILRTKMEEIGSSLQMNDQFNGPTLFLGGENSDYIGEKDVALIKKHFPNATIDVIHKAGHWVHAENPAEFYLKSLRFLNS